MTVYWEYAFAENFLLDGLLLYLAVACARGRTGILRLLFAAAVGGGEALLFPLFSLPAWAAYLLKFAGGALLALLAVKKGSLATHLVAIAAFFGLTFALGGLLVALYSFFGVPYTAGEGYLVEGAPVGLVVGVAGVFALLTVRGAKRFYRYRKVKRNLFLCRVGGAKPVYGFADSGNCLSFRGEPVCVVGAAAALAYFHDGPVGRIRLSTVNGSRDAPVFEAELEVGGKAFGRAYFTVGEVNSGEYRIILHTAFVEGRHENSVCIEGLAEEDRGL